MSGPRPELLNLRMWVAEGRCDAAILRVAEYRIACLRRRLADLAADHRLADLVTEPTVPADHPATHPGRGGGVAANTLCDATDPRGSTASLPEQIFSPVVEVGCG